MYVVTAIMLIIFIYMFTFIYNGVICFHLCMLVICYTFTTSPYFIFQTPCVLFHCCAKVIRKKEKNTMFVVCGCAQLLSLHLVRHGDNAD